MLNEEAFAATLADLNDRTPYRLAGDADSGAPDAPDSAGSKMLESVRDGVVELIEQNRDDWHDIATNERTDRLNDNGQVHEIADAAPDVYTHQRWAEFVDLQAYNEDPTELGDDGSDMTHAAAVCLYMIADRLAGTLIEEAAEFYCDALAELDEEDEADSE